MAFTTHVGLYESMVMFFGMINSPAVMNRDMRTFLFSVVSIFTFLFLEWTYIIGEVTWEVT